MLIAGIILIAGGAYYAYEAVRFLGSNLGGTETVNVILQIAVGLGAVYAGAQVIALRELGRLLGLGLSAVAAAFALLALIQGNPRGVFPLLLNSFVIYVLLTTAESFRRE